jgi:hypothetical protein
MKSYLLSAFVRTHSHLDEETFRLSEPSPWLVWEAGPWKPGGARTLTAAPPPPSLATVPAGAEALAFMLAPKDPSKDHVTLGRADTCDIVINDGTVSTQHLVFRRTPQGWTVEDAGSRNGSSLSGSPLEPGKPKGLLSTARLMAGSVAFSYYEPRDMLWRLKQYR